MFTIVNRGSIAAHKQYRLRFHCCDSVGERRAPAWRGARPPSARVSKQTGRRMRSARGGLGRAQLPGPVAVGCGDWGPGAPRALRC
ncbi:unnamed protein product [Colias eurytheme]|nr:unnamed protein product [Colias eurytheme]